VVSVDSNDFQIPMLPVGQKLVFNILTTWGDPYYVGLMGIEIFDRHGHLIVLSNPEKQLWANPADINILPEYGRYAMLCYASVCVWMGSNTHLCPLLRHMQLNSFAHIAYNIT
jgi:hypothetical protein